MSGPYFLVYKGSVYCSSGGFEDGADCDPEPFANGHRARCHIDQLKRDGFRFEQMPEIRNLQDCRGYPWSIQLVQYQ